MLKPDLVFITPENEQRIKEALKNRDEGKENERAGQDSHHKAD